MYATYSYIYFFHLDLLQFYIKYQNIVYLDIVKKNYLQNNQE